MSGGVYPPNGRAEAFAGPGSCNPQSCLPDNNGATIVHVGKGQGAFKENRTYTYVGAGNGDFEVEAPEGRQGPWLCIAIIILGVIAGILLAYLLMYVLSGQGSTSCQLFDSRLCIQNRARPNAQLLFCPQQGCTAEFCCEANQHCDTSGQDDWMTRWSEDRKRHCCEDRDEACYDCNAGLNNFNDGWSLSKKTWCCKKESKGCPTTEPFDCNAGLSNWKAGWSDAKKQWCCKNKNKACAHASGAFVMRKFGVSKCPDGYDIEDVGECTKACNQFGMSGTHPLIVHRGDYPRFCSAGTSTVHHDKRCYFNSHHSGHTNSEIAPVCKPGMEAGLGLDRQCTATRSNSVCGSASNLKVLGQCCPTRDNTMLECCTGKQWKFDGVWASKLHPKGDTFVLSYHTVHWDAASRSVIKPDGPDGFELQIEGEKSPRKAKLVKGELVWSVGDTWIKVDEVPNVQ